MSPGGTPAAPAAPAGRLTGLVGALRAHGFRIGTGETVDAGQALEAVGFTDRARVREALAATLLHGEGQRPVFDRVFDLYFPLGHTGAAGAYENTPADLAALRERLAEALTAGDGAALDRLAAEAVGGFGGYGSGPESDGWSSYQTLSRLRPETLLARVRERLRAAPGAAEPDFAERLLDDEIRRLIEAFRERVRTEARRRVAERQGRDLVARRAVAGTADSVDFLLAGRAQLDELRRTVRPLARKLATRLGGRGGRGAGGGVGGGGRGPGPGEGRG
ncbi:hypothetical protein ABT129_32490, partial [Streptomyces sp. NPDC002057]